MLKLYDNNNDNLNENRDLPVRSVFRFVAIDSTVDIAHFE